MSGPGDDLLFASEIQTLSREGRLEEAVQLGRAGVEAHPHYATGHLILGITHLDAGQYEEARLELEEARRLDGPGPALLKALTICYDGMGLTDLAEECRILGEGHGLEPSKDEYEGGPEMVEERDDSLDPGDGENEQDDVFGSSFEIGDDAGSPEDALKELEALLEGAGSSLEGETIDEGISVGDDPQMAEEPLTGDDTSPGAEAPAGDDKSDLWQQILEQAEAGEQPDGPSLAAGGVIDLDAGSDDDVPAFEVAGAIDLDAGSDDDVPAFEVAGAIDLDAGSDDDVPAFEVAGAIDLDAGSDDDVPAFEVAGAIDLDAGSEEDIPAFEVAGAIDLDAGPEEDAGAIDLDSPVSLDDVPDLEASVDMVEGLEIAAPGGESIDIEKIEDLDDTEDISTDLDDTDSIGAGDDLVVGPLELSDEVMDAASEGIELDSPFEVQPADSETAADEMMEAASEGIELDSSFEVQPADTETVADEDPEGVPDLSAVDDDELDIDEALKALEAELDTGSDPDAGVGSLLEDDQPLTAEAPAEIGLDDDDTVSLDLDQALTDLGDADDIDSVTADDVDSEGEDKSLPEDTAIASTGVSGAISNNDDSVMVAIQAEILAGKGLFDEAVRLFEALQIWEPDRESYRVRLEELRRMTQQPEESEQPESPE